MSLAQEVYTQAKGWSEFEVADNSKEDDKRLDFAHTIATAFNSKEGKEVLTAMVEKYLVRKVADPHDTQIGIGIKQGEANVVHYILSQIELSANS